jgi:hypothetical protein
MSYYVSIYRNSVDRQKTRTLKKTNFNLPCIYAPLELKSIIRALSHLTQFHTGAVKGAVVILAFFYSALALAFE